jgi:hypothetical protein
MNWQDDKDIFGRLHLLTQSELLKNIRNTIDQYDVDLSDCLSWGQLKSKQWLIDNLPDNLGVVFVCGGWYGTLAGMMFEQISKKFKVIRSFDIDPNCARIAESINKTWVKDNWRFKASTLDILQMDYPTTHVTYRANGSSLELTENPDTIINTSCEHIENFSDWFEKIPKTTLLILQSNNFYDIQEHVNCVDALETFQKQTNMSSLIYEGELDLGNYKRFMRIGYK